MVTYKLLDGHKPDCSKLFDAAEKVTELAWWRCIHKVKWSVWAVIQDTTCDPGYGKIVASVDLTGYEDQWDKAIVDVKNELLEREDFSDEWEFELESLDGPIIAIGEYNA